MYQYIHFMFTNSTICFPPDTAYNNHYKPQPDTLNLLEITQMFVFILFIVLIKTNSKHSFKPDNDWGRTWFSVFLVYIQQLVSVWSTFFFWLRFLQFCYPRKSPPYPISKFVTWGRWLISCKCVNIFLRNCLEIFFLHRVIVMSYIWIITIFRYFDINNIKSTCYRPIRW